MPVGSSLDCILRARLKRFTALWCIMCHSGWIYIRLPFLHSNYNFLTQQFLLETGWVEKQSGNQQNVKNWRKLQREKNQGVKQWDCNSLKRKVQFETKLVETKRNNDLFFCRNLMDLYLQGPWGSVASVVTVLRSWWPWLAKTGNDIVQQKCSKIKQRQEKKRHF